MRHFLRTNPIRLTRVSDKILWPLSNVYKVLTVAVVWVCTLCALEEIGGRRSLPRSSRARDGFNAGVRADWTALQGQPIVVVQRVGLSLRHSVRAACEEVHQAAGQTWLLNTPYYRPGNGEVPIK